MGILGIIGLILVVGGLIAVAVGTYHIWKEKHHGE